MLLRDLAAELKMIADRGGGFGSDTEDALRELAAILELRAEESLANVRKALTPKKKSPTPKAVAFDEAIVDRYVAKLEQTTNLAAAEVISSEMSSDKRVKLAEAIAIAKQYTKATKAFKTKASAFDAIKDRFRRQAWDKGALDIIRSQAAR